MLRDVKRDGAKGSLLCLALLSYIFSFYCNRKIKHTSSSWNMISAFSWWPWDVVTTPEMILRWTDPGENLHWFIKTPHLQKEQTIHVMFPSWRLQFSLPTWLPVRSSNTCRYFFILFLRRLEETSNWEFIWLLTTRSEPQAADWTCSGRSIVSWRKLVGTSVGSEKLWTQAGFYIFVFETRGIISAPRVYDSVRGFSGWRR